MFIKQTSLFILLIITVLKISAQGTTAYSKPAINDIFPLIQDDSFGGNIDLYQNPSLHILIDKNIRLNKKNGLTGYRIQIFSGTGNAARENANITSRKFRNNFPNFDSDLIYFEYKAPYFKVRVGDFRNKNEAFEYFHMINRKFPGSYIVKSRIKFPKLEANQNK